MIFLNKYEQKIPRIFRQPSNFSSKIGEENVEKAGSYFIKGNKRNTDVAHGSLKTDLIPSSLSKEFPYQMTQQKCASVVVSFHPHVRKFLPIRSET